MPPQLWELQFNPKSGFYEITENGITYRLRIEETRLLRDYFRGHRSDNGETVPTIAGWYKSVSNPLKKQVERSGSIPIPPPDFYPDIANWED